MSVASLWGNFSGRTRAKSARPMVFIARAAAPMFPGCWGSTSTMRTRGSRRSFMTGVSQNEERLVMRTLNKAVLAGSLLLVAGSASAAEFGMMETAERISRGMFKLSGYPVMVDRADDESGLALGLGYGLPYGMDVEGQIARYGDGTFPGADPAWAAWHGNRMAAAIGSGLHGGDLDEGGRALGADATAIFSYMPMHRLALSAALDASYDDVNNRDANVSPGSRFPTDGQYE